MENKTQDKIPGKNLIEISKDLRRKIIKTSSYAKIPHLGSCLSCIDLLVYLYWCEIKINPKSPTEIDRDRFLMSKGHGAPALFQVLAEKGFFPIQELEKFGMPGSVFHEHPPKPGYIKGVEAATGSLGHGFSMALGMSIAAKIQKKSYKSYALLSDGECNEGSVWEAAMLAASLEIDNLIGIIDYNKWQATGRSNEIMALEPLKSKWLAFGWHCEEIDGHDFHEIHSAITSAKNIKGKPSMIIAHTIKGKGVSFMEDDNNWHYRTPNDEELKKALIELRG